MNLTVIIIAKNAEKTIKEAIASVRDLADEIIVVDGGSIDKTVSVAEKNEAVVYTHTTNNFADMRNFGLAHAKSKWVFYLDTDERVSPELSTFIKQEIVKDAEYTAYKVQRKNFYLGSFAWPQIEKLERLFRKDSLKEWYGQLHESPRFEGKIGLLDGYVLHFTHQDISSMVEKTIVWSETEAKLRLAANHPQMSSWRFFRVMITAFTNSYIFQRGWKVGTAGIVESLYQAFSMFITYARLWELQQKENK